MSAAEHLSPTDTPPEDADAFGGFGTLDDKGRLSLPKAVRQALGVQPGSSVALIVVNKTLLVLPQDQHFVELMEQGAKAIADAGITTQDLLDALPAIREEIAIETYGAEFMAELERERQALQGEGNE